MVLQAVVGHLNVSIDCKSWPLARIITKPKFLANDFFLQPTKKKYGIH